MATKKSPKKQQRTRRQSTDPREPFYAMPRRYGDRKKLLAWALRNVVENERPKNRLDMAEHIFNIGLDKIGDVLEIDTSQAMVLFPDSIEVGLMEAIGERAERTGQSWEDVASGLITLLNSGDGSVVIFKTPVN